MITKCPVCTSEIIYDPPRYQVFNGELSSVIVSSTVRITCTQCSAEYLSAFDQRSTMVFGWVPVPSDKKIAEQKRHIIVPSGMRLT